MVKNSGNTTVKGKLVVHAGQTSPFIVDTATETYLLTVKRDNAITVSNSAGTVSVLDVITAPSPTLQLKNDTENNGFCESMPQKRLMLQGILKRP